LGEGRYAVSIGGSYGKGTFDAGSDLDFRLFCERRLPSREALDRALAALRERIAFWAERGITIDGCWVRTIEQIDRELKLWLNGEGQPVDLVWTVWGYHILTDIYNQMIIEDPYGIIRDWHARLSAYPPKLKQALLKKHLASLRYWRQDYHYRHKVSRDDRIFLAGLTSHLVHDIVQILFALNETYYAGDGNSMVFLSRFARTPDRVMDRIEAILYPRAGVDALKQQYDQLGELIDEVIRLASPEDAGAEWP
jgi:hypothetical protein